MRYFRLSLLIIVACLLFATPLALTGCGEPEVQTPKQYVPKYSVNQVIDVVRAQYPSCFKREQAGMDASGMFQYRTVDAPTQISVQFVGGTYHAWKATITCPSGYTIPIGAGKTTWWIVYFWETDGSLHSSY